MTDREKAARLRQVTQLVLEVRLARLRKTAAACDASRSQLQQLAQPADPGDLPVIAGQLAQLTYDRWAESRRAEINLLLARQTAEWMQARADAGLAFGKDTVVTRLSQRKAP